MGVWVTAVAILKPLDESTAGRIRQAWLDHLALCFPDQHLTKEQFVAVGRYFGEIDAESYLRPADEENSNMRLLTNQPINGKACKESLLRP